VTALNAMKVIIPVLNMSFAGGLFYDLEILMGKVNTYSGSNIQAAIRVHIIVP